MQWLRILRGPTLAIALLGGCRGQTATVATTTNSSATARPLCEVVHALRSGDSVDTRIERMERDWLVSLRLRISLGEGEPEVELYGLGRVSLSGRTPHCTVLDAGGEPGSQRFDEDLCLDAVESIADLLAAAEADAAPGTTVTEERTVQRSIRPRSRRRRRARIDVVRIRESAGVTRDHNGRAIDVAQVHPDGTREYVRVHYTSEGSERCVPTW